MGDVEVGRENTRSIDIVEPVMEGAKLDIDEADAQGSSTKEDDGTKASPAVGEPVLPQLPVTADDTEHEDWRTIPQNKSPSARRKLGNNGSLAVEIPTGSPSRYHLLSKELEEGEVGDDSSEEDTTVDTQAVPEKSKQKEKHKSWKNKKAQKSNPNTNGGLKKDQSKGAKNKQTNQASSWRH